MKHQLLGMGVLVMWLVAASPGLAGEPTLAGTAGAAGSPAATVATANLAVQELVLCAAIKDRSPAGVADTFPADIYSVYCYTRLAGTGGTAAIKHVWYRGETKAGEVRLAIKSLPWRTWSTKEMRKEWKGGWRVDVVGPDDTVLASKKFYLK